jgi:DNA-binding response OmpR family regulator
VTTVLVATDADWVLEEVDAALADEETQVYRVHSGREVAAACRAVNPDLVVLDLQIGNSGGVATALALRQDQDMGRLDHFAIVILLDRVADVFLAQMAQADGWLVKPLDALRLQRAAQAVLGGKTYSEGLFDAAGSVSQA